MVGTLLISEPASRLEVRAALLPEKAPAIVAIMTAWLTVPRSNDAIHAMWTGPEISSQIPLAELSPALRGSTPALQNATINPLAGDLVFLHFPEYRWGGSDCIFDLGLFYGDHGRLLFPIGWQPGSVFARVIPEDLAALAAACASIRSRGRARLEWKLG